ncbi:MAG: permease [Planctomycetota bacterium]
MNRRELRIGATFVVLFLLAYFLPLSRPEIGGAILEAFKLVQWYARNHTLACVVPALFIAGAIVTFLSQEAVLRHLGPQARPLEAYSVASVSGTVLAVCSCSVLPMFAGIYRVGAGLGPASTFLYAGPALNVLALFLTARVLGFELGLARGVGAIVFGILLGLLMALLYRRQETARLAELQQATVPATSTRPAWKSATLLASLIAFLVFSDWFHPGNVRITLPQGQVVEVVVLQETVDELVVQADKRSADLAVGEKRTLAKRDIVAIEEAESWVMDVYHVKWWLAGCMGLLSLWLAFRWLSGAERLQWMQNTWEFTKLLLPLLFGGVFVVGFLGALLPEGQVAAWVGDEGLAANLVASLVGCLFYFATLTEVPILQALMEHGMARGPALALLLAGPALSLPSLLVIRSVLGTQKTIVFTVLVVLMATIAGYLFGHLT